ncbi:MAG: DUF2090 domain-containing protein [Patescibacteria group bacterium]
MAANLGYTKPLFILAFDHRSSFIRDLLHLSGELEAEDFNRICDLKYLIYQGFVKAVANNLVPKERAAILIDKQFGDKILHEAKTEGYTVCLSVEKSGQAEFTLEYSKEFSQHIEKYQLTFVKALIRYNPQGDQELNLRQQKKLKELSDWCHQSGYKFLIETLVPATEEQLAQAGDISKYDQEIRPLLVVKMIAELQTAGVEPDVWKIEGMTKSEDYQATIKQIKTGGRDNVNLVILGRGENPQNMERWLKAGKGIAGVIGFAIGRTIFLEPLKQYLNKKITSQQAIDKIADQYHYFYKIFNS